MRENGKARCRIISGNNFGKVLAREIREKTRSKKKIFACFAYFAGNKKYKDKV